MERLQPPLGVVVDDDAVILMDAAFILEDAGFQVFTAMQADEALAHLVDHAGEIAVLFTDVDMPGAMDGFSLARLTAMTWPDVSILVASGRRAPDQGDMPAGALFIVKPFNVELVHGCLQKLVPGDRQPDPLRHRH